MSHAARLDYKAAAPELMRALGGVHQSVAKSGLPGELIDLVYLRVSQINGCAYCVDLHWRDALEKQADARKLNSVVSWPEAPFFSARERAALRWAEVLTRVADGGAPQHEYAAVAEQFAGAELAALTLAIALMNCYNRLGVGFAQRPAA